MKDITKVELVDGSNKVVATHFISKVSIMDNARRLKLMAPYMEDESLDVYVKNTKFSAAALVCSLCDKNGKPIYPDDDAVEKMLEDMSFEVFNVLCEEYNKINPPTATLQAKKKKS